MTINLIVTPVEAMKCAAALDFLRKSMTLNLNDLSFNFQDGGSFGCDMKGYQSIAYLSNMLKAACANEADSVHFAGYCKTH